MFTYFYYAKDATRTVNNGIKVSYGLDLRKRKLIRTINLIYILLGIANWVILELLDNIIKRSIRRLKIKSLLIKGGYRASIYTLSK